MLNLVALMGRLTADPELRHTNTGISVTSFALAVERRYKTGEERTADFINIVAWRQTADFVAKYFKKGQLVAVDGSIQTRKYTDREGNNRTSFEVIANNVHFAEPRRDGGGSYNHSEQTSGNQTPVSFANTDAGDFTEITGDDDLPF